MTTTTVLAIVVIAAVLIIAAMAYALFRKQRTRKLRSHFGPEYEHAFRQYGESAKAEDALTARQKRMEKIHIHALSDQERDRFTDLWHGVQARFVDDPAESIREADRLVTDVMTARGYPMAEFERRAEDISVDYPLVVSNYRMAHEIALNHQAGKATTEDLRKAVVCYRKLCEELLEGHVAHRR
jgi:hypothetical protein